MIHLPWNRGPTLDVKSILLYYELLASKASITVGQNAFP